MNGDNSLPPFTTFTIATIAAEKCLEHFINSGNVFNSNFTCQLWHLIRAIGANHISLMHIQRLRLFSVSFGYSPLSRIRRIINAPWIARFKSIKDKWHNFMKRQENVLIIFVWNHAKFIISIGFQLYSWVFHNFSARIVCVCSLCVRFYMLLSSVSSVSIVTKVASFPETLCEITQILSMLSWSQCHFFKLVRKPLRIEPSGYTFFVCLILCKALCDKLCTWRQTH